MVSVLGIDGKEYKLKLVKTKRNLCSSYHLRVRNLLKKLFPLEVIFEEVSLPGSSSKKRTLSADFYIHSIKLMVEVHGQQHYEKTSMFHRSDADFHQGRIRDNDKKHWCEINNIALVTLPYSETDDEWRNRIENRS